MKRPTEEQLKAEDEALEATGGLLACSPELYEMMNTESRYDSVDEMLRGNGYDELADMIKLTKERDALAAENARLREDMKQILGICSGIQDSYTRLLLVRDVASKSPHGDHNNG